MFQLKPEASSATAWVESLVDLDGKEVWKVTSIPSRVEPQVEHGSGNGSPAIGRNMPSFRVRARVKTTKPGMLPSIETQAKHMTQAPGVCGASQSLCTTSFDLNYMPPLGLGID